MQRTLDTATKGEEVSQRTRAYGDTAEKQGKVGSTTSLEVKEIVLQPMPVEVTLTRHNSIWLYTHSPTVLAQTPSLHAKAKPVAMEDVCWHFPQLLHQRHGEPAAGIPVSTWRLVTILFCNKAITTKL